MFKDFEDDTPSWFSREPPAAMKGRFKDAVVNFILFKGLRHKKPRHTVHLTKTILPWIRALDSKWSTVTSAQYNPTKHVAHQRYNETVRNLLNSESELERMLVSAEADLDRQTELEMQRSTTPPPDLADKSPAFGTQNSRFEDAMPTQQAI